MPELHLKVLPAEQRRLWGHLQKLAGFLNPLGYYLAGGTALALQIGHRRSLDFDFFSVKPGLGTQTQKRAEHLEHFLARDFDQDTLHAEIAGVKVSFISAYKYPTVEPFVAAGRLKLASMMDIGLMKLLALTHRSALRDYLDLAVIVRDHIPLQKLLETSRKKYGRDFNRMIPLRALVTFTDLDQEMPAMLDKTLKKSWQKILRDAVKKTAG